MHSNDSIDRPDLPPIVQLALVCYPSIAACHTHMSTTTVLLPDCSLTRRRHRHPEPTRSSAALSLTTITCGPRDNRGPLVRGRTLSTEAILAVQSLKRSPDLQNPSHLSRLLKPDLIAAACELLRQDLPLLALRLLPFLRSEPNYSPNANLSLYADFVKCLSRNDLVDETRQFVTELAGELDREGGIRGEDLRGPARLMKSLVAAGRAEEVRIVYGLMKRGGCVPNEYLFKFLMRGLRRLGDVEGAMEVGRDYEEWDVRGVWGRTVPAQ